VLGGVCCGFAHYLSIDPVAVRIITICLDAEAALEDRSASSRRSIRGSRCV
jgi:hypothetical protein